MTVALNVLFQVVVMFILMGVGFICSKKRILDEKAAAQMSSLLLIVVSPCVILKSFQIDFDKDMAFGLLISLSLAVIVSFVGIAVGAVFIHTKDEEVKTVEKFSIVYTNCGFMAIPLIQAVLGSNGVFYASVFIAAFNVFLWTHGVITMKKGVSPKEILGALKSPSILAIGVGLILFLFSLRLPSVINEPIDYISSLNTPLAMIVTGVYVAKANLVKAFANKRIYFVCLLRLAVVPIIMIPVYFLFKGIVGAETIITANFIAAACPTASAALMMAARYNRATEYASQIITVTTLLSVISLPLMVFLMKAVLTF